MRLTWAQPEDLVPAELAALREQGVPDDELSAIERRWADAGGSDGPRSLRSQRDTGIRRTARDGPSRAR
ncbi:hypothetical protein QE367_002109 [Microbacterium paludicola]|uniref:Uncharacterized protein n=1 Tax=Microbacterium paludicola TaxID=300019 RepID=A0ABU1I1Z0_9MICO|nr:hypothetical protein [Microbacterium paludicola]MDR6167905.1 hypothetical protein [Microbacterium paludicola]